MKVRMKLGIAIVIAPALLAASITSAAAFTFTGAGLYAFFATQGVSGLFVIDRATTADPRLKVALVHTPPHQEVAFRFRSITCDGTPSASNRVLAINHTSDALGDHFFGMDLSSAVDYGSIRSVWITSTDGTDCTETVDFMKVVPSAGAFNADSLLSWVKMGDATLAVFMYPESSSMAALDIVSHGTTSSDVFRIRAVNKPCAKSPTQTLLTYEFQDFDGARIIQDHVSLDQNQMDAIRSLRVRDLGTDATWCGPASLLSHESLP